MANEEKPRYWKAVLKFGNVYMLRSKRFDKGVEVPVEHDVKTHLEANAVDNLTIENGSEEGQNQLLVRQKFQFVEIDEATFRQLSGQSPAEEVKARIRNRS